MSFVHHTDNWNQGTAIHFTDLGLLRPVDRTHNRYRVDTWSAKSLSTRYHIDTKCIENMH